MPRAVTSTHSTLTPCGAVTRPVIGGPAGARRRTARRRVASISSAITSSCEGA